MVPRNTSWAGIHRKNDKSSRVRIALAALCTCRCRIRAGTLSIVGEERKGKGGLRSGPVFYPQRQFADAHPSGNETAQCQSTTSLDELSEVTRKLESPKKR